MHARALRNDQNTKFEVHSFTHRFLRYDWEQNFKKGHVVLTTPTRAQSVIPRLAPDVFYLYTKFGDSRFGRSGDMIADVKNENGSFDPDHTPLGVVCFPRART